MENLYNSRMHGFLNMSSRAGILVNGANGPAAITGEQPFTEESVLSLLIVLGSSISLVGLVFAFITYSLFSDLRSLSGTTLMNLLAALFMTQLLYVIGVGGVPDPHLCVSLAAALQYVRLASLCWLLVMAHHMHAQFRTNLNLVPVPETHIGSSFIKYSVCAWGFPGIILGASLFVQYRDKAGRLSDARSLADLNCWFMDYNAYIYGLVVPSAFLLLATLYMLIRAAIVARLVASMQVDRRTKLKMQRKRTLQIVLFFKIGVLLATVIVLGTLTKFMKSDALWMAFNVGQGTQGIFIALLVTCNCQVLKIYTRSLKGRSRKRSCSEGYVTSYDSTGTKVRGRTLGALGATTEISRSTSLQLLTWDPTPDAV